MKSSQKGLMIFRYNLRLHDNEALLLLQKMVNRMDCLWVIEPQWLHHSGRALGNCYGDQMGQHRRRFLLESANGLRQQLQARGSDLLVAEGDFVRIVSEQLNAGDYDVVALADHPGYREQRQVRKLAAKFAKLHWIIADDFYLLRADQLPFSAADFPRQFTPFRKAIMDICVSEGRELIGALPQTAAGDSRYAASQRKLVQLTDEHKVNHHNDETTAGMLGGESAGLEQLNRYLHEWQHVRHYKETRNQLEGWDFSSKLSPWLAQGCLSVRRVYREIKRHEDRYGENDSTDWLRFELIWREYFQWLARFQGAKLFRLRGIRDVNPLLSYYPEYFVAWREGATPNRFVNAFMQQLKTTGWMSNRGRQIVASYLVNELGLDWRYGASWFEQQLIDYDCGPNWGNWQYLAGVGTDPRGRRRFDIAKQQALYDPDGSFTDKWAGTQQTSFANAGYY